jgi:hypothetical protein
MVLEKIIIQVAQGTETQATDHNRSPNKRIPKFVLSPENQNVSAAIMPIALMLKIMARFRKLTLGTASVCAES